jgi:hypothetical protein
MDESRAGDTEQLRRQFRRTAVASFARLKALLDARA